MSNNDFIDVILTLFLCQTFAKKKQKHRWKDPAPPCIANRIGFIYVDERSVSRDRHQD